MRELQEDAAHEARIVAAQPITGRTNRRGLIVAGLAALLMAFVGAFGTGALPLLPRLAYWLIVMESGALVGIGASTGVRSWGGLADSPILEGAAISLLVALPLTFVASGATALFFGPQQFGFQGTATLFAAVFVVTAAITAINYITGKAAMPAAAPTPSVPPLPNTSPVSSPTPVPSRLAERLPMHLRAATVLALEAEDHYVRVHTDAGSALLLLRLSDAVAELDALAGARTHRSWWVARDAVVTAKKGEGRGELLLANGSVVPVSRSALTLLQQEGWFDNRLTGVSIER